MDNTIHIQPKLKFLLMLLPALLLFGAIAFAGTDAVYAESNTIYTDKDAASAGNGSLNSPYKDFAEALAAADDGDTIRIIGGAFLNALEGEGARTPMIIDKEITICSAEEGTKATLNNRREGIFLAADASFRDVEIIEANGYHPAIYACGNRLLLDNVTASSTGTKLSLFAGGLYQRGSYAFVTPSGNAEITIKGGSGFGGDVFLGSEGGVYNGNVTLNLENLNAKAIDGIYGSGADEPDFDMNDMFGNIYGIEQPEANHAFHVDGDVSVSIKDAATRSIVFSGTTGNRKVDFYQLDDYLTDICLDAVDELTISKGNVNITDMSAGTSPLNNFSLEAAAGASVNLSGLQTPRTLNAFAGGGSLTLASKQVLTITGDVSNQTVVLVDKTNNGNSLQDRDVLIDAPRSADNAFVFNEAYKENHLSLVRTEGGKWVVSRPETVSITYIANNPTQGTTSIDYEDVIKGQRPEGCTALPNKGYKFKHWARIDEDYNEIEIVSTDATLIYAGALEDKQYDFMAVFEEEPEQGSGTEEETVYSPAEVKLSATSYTYSGTAKKPSVTVTDTAGKTIPPEYYTVSYTGNKSVGKAAAKIVFSGRYSGSMTANFKINPKGTSISRLAKGKKSFQVKWKKQSAKMAASRITGYQVRYSRSSAMENAKTTTVKGYKTVSKKVTKLKARKKYYVQVRTYKTVNGVKYYSSWSARKAVTTR